MYTAGYCLPIDNEHCGCTLFNIIVPEDMLDIVCKGPFMARYYEIITKYWVAIIAMQVPKSIRLMR
jgi:hypothetical protein